VEFVPDYHCPFTKMCKPYRRNLQQVGAGERAPFQPSDLQAQEQQDLRSRDAIRMKKVSEF